MSTQRGATVGAQADTIKQHGVHYTPPALAAFLARATYAAAKQQLRKKRPGGIRILDPACGDGALLSALVRTIPKSQRKDLQLVGFERDREAANAARSALAILPPDRVEVYEEDFLDSENTHCDNEIDNQASGFDIVIANPPYVRTQVMGAHRAATLSKQFGLTGRVDLYHAFAMAMAGAVREGGVLGLLTSNRFLTIKSGIRLRQLLTRQFQLRAIYDLGDTRLFAAAVLPVVVVGEKHRDAAAQDTCFFRRAYEHRVTSTRPLNTREFDHIIDAIEDPTFVGLAQTDKGTYRVEAGMLSARGEDDTWSLATPENDQWLATVRRFRKCCFDDLAQVRVGIKTTADAVFIQERWDHLPEHVRPEAALLHPLITHHHAARWRIGNGHKKSVLYPHQDQNGRRTTIALEDYPRAANYFESHAARLKSRNYVTDSGRAWYEIWVPHHPADWSKPKIVFPDISECPMFFLDRSAAVVNGDCYWITLKPDVDDDWLYLILAVANSSFITHFYDVTFHNKLYAGRRRFMTQYVKQFPLPDLHAAGSQKIVALVKQLVSVECVEVEMIETQVDALVGEAFGVRKSPIDNPS